MKQKKSAKEDERKKLCQQKVPQEGNRSVTVDSFHKAGKIRKNFPAWIQIRSTRMKIAELMAELVQRQRYAFMCQDEQNNASVRAKENMVTWTKTHTRIDTLKYGGNKTTRYNRRPK